MAPKASTSGSKGERIFNSGRIGGAVVVWAYEASGTSAERIKRVRRRSASLERLQRTCMDDGQDGACQDAMRDNAGGGSQAASCPNNHPSPGLPPSCSTCSVRMVNASQAQR